MQIDTEIIDGCVYYSMYHRAISYSLRYYDGRWELHSHRVSLGRYNPGSIRFFNTLEELEKSLKSFRGISAIIPEA